MKYNKSEIMKRAWEIKRYQEKHLVEKYRESFGECLKRAWAEAKEKANPMVWAYVVPMWKWQEAGLFGVRSNIVKETQIEKESKKAFRVYGEWIPKCICDYKKVAA